MLIYFLILLGVIIVHYMHEFPGKVQIQALLNGETHNCNFDDEYETCKTRIQQITNGTTNLLEA